MAVKVVTLKDEYSGQCVALETVLLVLGRECPHIVNLAGVCLDDTAGDEQGRRAAYLVLELGTTSMATILQ